MNKDKLRECLSHRVRLRPSARRLMGHRELRSIDDDWLVESIDSTKGVFISNVRTGHRVILGFDQIHHYTTDPHLERDGLRHGFFELRVQLTLRGANARPEPFPSYFSRVASSRSHTKK